MMPLIANSGPAKSGNLYTTESDHLH